MIGLLGAKVIAGVVGAMAIASCGAYAIHTLKAAGANEVAAKVGAAQLVAQKEQLDRQQADVAKLVEGNAALRKTAEGRQRALNTALATLKHTEATGECPANCTLVWPSY